MALSHCTQCTHCSRTAMDTRRVTFKRLNLKKSPEETGLTAGLLKAAPEESLAQTLAAFNIVFESGRIPDTWTITTFRMLPKKTACHSSDRLRTYCRQKAFLQGIWVSVPWPCEGGFGGETTGRTTWPSTRQKGGRTFVDTEPSTAQSCRSWNHSVGCKFRLLKRITFSDFDPVCRAAAHLGHRK